MSRDRVRLFTSESVTEGHPDKLADQFSDAVLDAMLMQDPRSRVAVETLLATGEIVVRGEVTTRARMIDYSQLLRGVALRVGYNNEEVGLNAHTCRFNARMNNQSEDIARGVDGEVQGAGDQGMMVGYAVRETPELMPASIAYAHALTRRLEAARHSGTVPWLRPDGKAQVTMEYRNGKPFRVHTIVVSAQHAPEVKQEEIVHTIREQIIRSAIPEGMLDDRTVFHINPTGRFVIGGPHGDCGLTGRKIIVDTYGGHGGHGGGAFSGKDPSKVDRSAAYMARYVAKNIVASGVADRCLVQLSYGIGIAEPISVDIETFGTARVDEERLEQVVRELFPLTPAGIIRHLDLLRPIYLVTASGGHFGREYDEARGWFTWERTDLAAQIAAAF